mmetsp:Transcript_43886/g.103331  ORF Transcript_43886/g.103331 Transcript_43886/m.103331 type:complete len:216 (+) Transcript_43886:615-1262(+)
MPSSFCSFFAKYVKPPDRIPILYPSVLRLAMRRGAPSVMGSVSAIPWSTLSGMPFSSRIRRLKLSWKSISPRMAASVISATCVPTPAHFASSSITSHWISVLSMSKRIRRRFRLNTSSSWTATSTSCSIEILKSSSRRASTLRGLPLMLSCSAEREFWMFELLREGQSERRVMVSMFIELSAITFVTRESEEAWMRRARTVTVKRPLFCERTQRS